MQVRIFKQGPLQTVVGGQFAIDRDTAILRDLAQLFGRVFAVLLFDDDKFDVISNVKRILANNVRDVEEKFATLLHLI
jgi:hypothetical protein